MNDFLEMLTTRRPAGGFGEEYFVQTWLKPLGAWRDPYGNHWIEVGEEYSTLFSAHTDSVHGDNDLQDVEVDEERFEAFKTDGRPLGADNAAGCWILIQLIKAGIPGLYIFHTEEERGGGGSRYVARNYSDVFEGRIKRAIAFDRRGTTDIITHQASGRCCSDTFAKALAEALGMEHAPSDRGIFTDTANYIEIIPECTNVAVGYANEHTGEETQDLLYLFNLAERVIEVDWDALPTARDPDVIDISDWHGYGRVPGTYYGGRPLESLHEDRDPYEELVELCTDDPFTAAELLEDYGITPKDFLDAQRSSGYNTYTHGGKNHNGKDCQTQTDADNRRLLDYTAADDYGYFDDYEPRVVGGTRR